jgi:uracil-DNA glycosylase family 4
MEPDKRRAGLEALLRYYEDLGLGPFFLRRAAGAGVADAGPSASVRDEIDGAESAPAEAKMRTRRSSSLGAVATPARPPALAVAALLPASSLFDALDQIEGDTLEAILEFIGDCTRCKLSEGRNKIVFGDGNPRAQLVFIGEGPGHDEDIQGLPFVGRAGKLLTQMIEAMGLKRNEVYICNVVKCRPPANRTPEKDEVATCSPFLMRQLRVIQPKAVVCLGAVALQALLGPGVAISRVRGQWMNFHGMQMMPTYHPAFLLRNPAAKASVWEDLKKVMALLGLEPRRAAR